MNDKEFEQILKSGLETLDKERQPERDLWPGIEFGLENQQPQKPVSYIKPLSMAAAVAMVSIVGWMSFQSPVLSTQDTDLVTLLTEQHDQQKQALLVSFQNEPALTGNWQQQLTELDEAAMAIKKALAEDENNLALLKMLQRVHQQQIDLIERVHAPTWRKI